MQRYFITAIIVLFFMFDIKVGYSASSGVVSHIFFALCHANIFHLICNVIALYVIKGNLHLIPAFLISFLCSYLPIPFASLLSFSTQPTLGLSGVLFAIIGIKWGKYYHYVSHLPLVSINWDNLITNTKRFIIYTFAPLIITMFIPNVNWVIHLYALTIGLIYGYFHKRFF